jgi:Mg2+ and Co2+ transporter CorA
VVEKLIPLLEQQTQTLLELWDVIVRQREALREERLSSLQELMKNAQSLSVRARTLEAARERETKALAALLGCDATVSALAAKLTEEEATRLRAAGDALRQAVLKLKSEMQILSKLVEQSAMLGELLVNEWRRLEGSFGTPSSGCDFRG